MTVSLERYAVHHPRVADVVLALTLCACTVFGAQISTPDSVAPQDVWPARILALVSCAAILKSRAHPRAVLVVTAAAAAVMTGLDYLPSPLLLAPVMTALHRLAALTDSRTTRRYGYTTMAVLVITSVSAAPLGDQFLLRSVGTVLWLLLPLSAGSMARLRRAYLESVQARAAHAERTREEEARLRVTEERMRIARELHDVVAHHMAVANAQAGTAAHLAPTHPEQARKILADLAGTTSSALLELRATVGILRQADDPGPDSLEPTPGLDRLPDLIAACRSAGLDVRVTTEGEPQPLLPGVDLTAYRIVQEALTNVTRHASGHPARIRLAYTDSRLIVTVTNDGDRAAPAAPGSGGFGLIGMRERAHSVGGDLRAGPLPGGGFEVTTALPLHPHALHEDEAPL
ncbi:sensor histidine kinase [Streptomyces sp. NPDC046915]|uniref:sensor histidine kinase n=1 Tax=Streptomyces sp. NPDC046915 TaxID=3155257 RepID=UPI0033EAB8D1